MDIISKRLKELRNSKNLTVEKFAKNINLPTATYHHYEMATRKLPCDVLIAICKFYSVPADYLLGLTDIY